MSYLRRFACLALMLAPLVLFVESTSAAAFKRAHEGETAPTFTLPDLAGVSVDLGTYKDGPLTIVSFWALWSPKSEPLLKDVQRLLDEFGEKGVRALGMKALAVNSEGQTPPADLDEQVQKFVAANGLKFPMLIDRKLEQYDAWGVVALPATAFVGKDLKIVYEFSGHPTSAYEEMRDKVMEVLGIKDQEVAQQKPKRERYKPTAKMTTLSYGMAEKLYERGKYSEAAKKLEKVLVDEPKFPDAHALNGAIQVGVAREAKSEPGQGARDAFAKAVELDATVPLGLAGLAYFAIRDKDIPKALELAKKAQEFTEAPTIKHSGAPRVSGSPRSGITDVEAPVEKRAMKDGVQLKDGSAVAAPGAEPSAAKPEDKPAEPAKAEATAGGPESKPEDKPAAPEMGKHSVDVAALLADVEKAQAAGDSQAAAADLEKAVEALMGMRQGVKLKKEGLMEKIQKQP